MPSLMSLEGSLGCMGCTRPTSQPGTNGVSLAGSLGNRVITSPAPCVNCIPGVAGLGGSFDVTGLMTSPFVLGLIGLGIGAFLAYRTLPPDRGHLSGHRRRRRR
jgi:hypothetical protein